MLKRLLVGLGTIAVLTVLPGAAVAQDETDYPDVLAADGLRLIARGDADLSGDGLPETVLVAISTECGSCHAKYLSVYSGTDLLASMMLDDPEIVLLPGLGLQIKQPIRRENESYCCPTQFRTTWYALDAATQQLVELDTAPEPLADPVPLTPVEVSPQQPTPLAPSTAAAAPWPRSSYCANLGDRVEVLFKFANPDLAWSNIVTEHGLSFYNPILRQSGYQYRGGAYVYSLWINRALQADPVPYIGSREICDFLEDAFAKGDGGETGRALNQLGALVPRLWCEQLKLKVRGRGRPDPRIYNSPDGRTSYLFDLRDEFGSEGAGLRQIVYDLALPTQGSLASSFANQWQQSSTGILRNLDVNRCASEP